MKETKKVFSILMAVMMIFGLITTPVQARGGESTNGWGWPYGGWWSWWGPQPTQPEPEPEPEEDPVVEEAAEEEEEEIPEVTPAEEAPVEEEQPAAEPEYAEDTIPAVGNHYTAYVSFTKEAQIPAGTTAELTEFAEGSQEYEDAKAAVLGEGNDAAGFIAFDISLFNNGTVIEPNGSAVSVSIELNNLPEEAIAAADTLELTHINEQSGETEVVATADQITVTGEDSATAEFTVDSFSTFTLTWGTSAAPKTATIHWGYNDNGEFVEFGDSASLDSNAGSMSLDIIFDGYLYSGAQYVKDGTTYALSSEILEKVTEGDSTTWTMVASVPTGSGSETEAQTVTVEEGSDIYVYYVEKEDDYTPPAPAPADVKGPITKKTVTDNHDGTYKIRLDVTGEQDHTVNRVGANVIVVMDRTSSMNQAMPDGGNRMAAARTALQTLIATLKPGTGEDEHLINLTVVEFANSQNYQNGLSWTQSRSAMETYARNLDYISGSGGNGTCWQAGLYGGIVRTKEANADADMSKNKTYVIFVTDGNPNAWYTGTNSDGGPSNRPNYQQQGTGQFVQAAYNAAIPNAVNVSALSGYNLYGVFCGSTADMVHLQDLMNYNGNQGRVNGTFIDGTSASAINNAFENIASTIVNDLGSSNVTVDDGIPTLANVSAAVSGTAGGFKYYIKPEGGEETEWEDAPSAGYSTSNGVTWDLSEAGVLANGTTYSLEFDVWPTQAAYDLIADLNNGIRFYSYADYLASNPDPALSEEEAVESGIVISEAEKAGVTGDKTSGYTLLTNTHLFTSYSYNGTDYRDPINYSEEAMPLPTETISVEKIWHNFLDSRTEDDIDGLKLILTKNGEPYLPLEVNSDNDWKVEDIYISVGMIAHGEILETGHDYYVIEERKDEQNDKTEYWEINSPVYHPMIVDGTMKMFIESDTEDPSGFSVTETVDGETVTKYYKLDEESTTLAAINERVSWLNLTKVVTGNEAPIDTMFEYKVTITQPVTGNDIMFSCRSFANTYGGAVPYRDDLETTAEPVVVGNDTYYRVASGTEFTVKIAAGWNIRFLNLETTSTYSIEEINVPDGYIFDSAKNTETLYSAKNTPADGYPIVTTEDDETDNGAAVDGEVVTGTINQTNTDYTVEYTNQYLGFFYVYHSSNNEVERIFLTDDRITVNNEKRTFDIYAETYPDTLYGGYYSDYAGKSEGYDSAALDYSDDSKDFDTDGKAYSYEYIQESNKAAWKYADGYDTIGTAMEPAAFETYYLKEVPTGYLRPYTHFTYYKSNKKIGSMWSILDLDDLNYQKAWFTVQTDNKPAIVCEAMNVKASNGTSTVTLTAGKVFKSKGVLDGYLGYAEVNSYLGKTTVVRQYWQTKDGIEVHGTHERTMTYSNGLVYTGLKSTDTEIED